MSSKDKTPRRPPPIVDDRDLGHPAQQSQKRQGTSADHDSQMSPPSKKTTTSPVDAPKERWEPPLSDEDLRIGMRAIAEDLGFDLECNYDFQKWTPEHRRENEELACELMRPVRHEIVEYLHVGIKEIYGDYSYVSPDRDQRRAWNHPAFGSSTTWLLDEKYWKTLRLNINHFIEFHFPEEASLDAVDDATAAKARSLSLQADNLVRTNLNQFAWRFYTAWLWHILCDELFSPDNLEKWREGPWRSFGAVQKAIRPSVTQRENVFTHDFYKSRQMVSRMLYMLHGEHTDWVRLGRIILRELAPFMKINGIEHPESDPSVRESLGKVLDAARDVEQIASFGANEFRITMRDPETNKRHSFLPSKDITIMDPWHSGDVEPWEDESQFPVETVYGPLVQVLGGDHAIFSHFKTCTWSVPMVYGRKQFEIKKFPSLAEYRRHKAEQREKWMAENAAKEDSEKEQADIEVAGKDEGGNKASDEKASDVKTEDVKKAG